MIVLQETPFAANQPITCSKTFSFPFFDNLVSMRAKRAHESARLLLCPPPCSVRSINPPRFYFHKRARLSLKRKQRVCEKASQTKVNRLSYTIRDISGLICFLFLERRSLLLNSKLSTVKQTIYGRRAGTLVDIWVSAQCCKSRWISLILSYIAVIC